MKTDNEIIAEFMGLQVYQTWEEMRAVPINNLKAWALPDHLGYHYSWDRLMPVVEKIIKIPTGDDDFFYARTFGMRDADGNFLFRFNRFQVITAKTLIDAVYSAVVEFIKWYNENHG